MTFVISDKTNKSTPELSDELLIDEGGGVYRALAIGDLLLVVRDASDTGTDTYESDLGGDLSSGDVFTLDFQSVNTTSSPTLENAGGAPSGAKSIITKEGAAFAGMFRRTHRLRWNGTSFVLEDPLGGVVDKGSGSNGDYVLYGDGTLICRHTLSDTVDIDLSGGGINFSAAVTWTYPKAFSAAPQVSVQEYSASVVWADLSDAPGTTSADVRFLRVQSTTSQSVSASLIAIGEG